MAARIRNALTLYQPLRTIVGVELRLHQGRRTGRRLPRRLRTRLDLRRTRHLTSWHAASAQLVLSQTWGWRRTRPMRGPRLIPSGRSTTPVRRCRWSSTRSSRPRVSIAGSHMNRPSSAMPRSYRKPGSSGKGWPGATSTRYGERIAFATPSIGSTRRGSAGASHARLARKHRINQAMAARMDPAIPKPRPTPQSAACSPPRAISMAQIPTKTAMITALVTSTMNAMRRAAVCTSPPPAEDLTSGTRRRRRRCTDSAKPTASGRRPRSKATCLHVIKGAASRRRPVRPVRGVRPRWAGARPENRQCEWFASHVPPERSVTSSGDAVRGRLVS